MTQEERQATIDAIERFRNSDPDLVKRYDVEFVIANFNHDKTSALTEFLSTNKIKVEKLKHEASDVFVVVNMQLDLQNVIDIESFLTYFADNHGCKYDGWGAFE